MSDVNEAVRRLSVDRLKSAIEKNASFWNHFKDALVAAGAGAAVTAGGSLATSGFKSIRGKLEKPRAYKNMMSAMPGLKKEDPRAVQMTFNTLYGMNRKMAKDPLVAGSFVSRNVSRAELGGEAGAYVDPQTAKTLLDAGAKRTSGPIESAWQRGATNINMSMHQEGGGSRRRHQAMRKR
jgi:hypothetical protein